MNFKTVSKKNTCPHCDGAKDCKTLPSSDLVLCRSAAKDGYVRDGWISKGLSEGQCHGLWLKVAPKPDSSGESVAVENKRSTAVDDEKTTIDRRHRLWTDKLANCLSLHPADKEDLTRRGLTEAQIKKWGIISTNYDGDWAGYYCPCLTPNGKIIGAQIRTRGTNEEIPRYYWARTSKKHSTKFNGELPLACHRPIDRPSTGIAIVEGIGAKSFILAQKSGNAVIGFGSSAQLQGSHTLWQQYLAELSEELGTKAIAFYPDSGAVKNLSVWENYTNGLKQFEEWGYTIEIKWWGQIDKGSDVDEIEDLSIVRTISFNELRAIAAQYLPIRPEGAALVDLSVPEDGTDIDAYWEDSDRDDQGLTEARTESDRLAEEAANAQGRMAWGQKQALRIDKDQGHWQTLNESGATVNESGIYLDRDSLKLGKPGIYILNASMGAGKTATVIHQAVKEAGDRPIYGFSPRNALAFQMGEVVGLKHHTEFSGNGYPNQATLCAESTYRVVGDNNNWQDAPLLIFDEVSQTIGQLLAGQTGQRNLVLNLDRLAKGLQRCNEMGGSILLSEDGVTNLEVEFIQRLSGMTIEGHTNFTKIYEKRNYTLFKNNKVVAEEIVDRLNRGENLIVATDSQNWARSLERFILQNSNLSIKDLLLVDKDATNEPKVLSFKKDPDGYIQAEKPRAIIYTPTLQSGVSIADPEGHFHALAFNISHLPARIAKQLPERLRTDVPRFGCVTKAAHGKGRYAGWTDWKDIVKALKTGTNLNNQIIGLKEHLAQFEFDRDGAMVDALAELDRARDAYRDQNSLMATYLEFWAKYQARENYEKTRIQKDLLNYWEAQGHIIDIDDRRSEESTTEQFAQIKEDIADDRATEYAKADVSTMTTEIANAILENPGDRDRLEIVAASKYKQIQRYPQAEHKFDEVEFVKKIQDRSVQFLRGCESLYLRQNPQTAVAQSRQEWLGRLKAQKNGRMMWLPDCQNKAAIATLLRSAPIDAFIDGSLTEWHRESPEVQDFYKWAIANQRQLIDLLNIGRGLSGNSKSSRDQGGLDVLHKVLKKLGFEVRLTNYIGARGKQKRVYAIVNLDDPDRQEILGAIGRRYAAWEEQDDDRGIHRKPHLTLVPDQQERAIAQSQ